MTLRKSAIAFAVGIAALPIAAQAQHVLQVPGSADFLAIDGDSVWMTNTGRVERWSHKGKLAEVPIARPCGAMVIADGGLWVVNCVDGSLNRIDIKTAKLVATIPTGVAKGRGFEHQLAAGAGSVWIANDAKGTIARVDTKTNQIVATVEVDPSTSYLTFGYGSLWAVCLPGQTIQKIDPATNKVVKRTAVGKAPGFLAAGEDGIWAQEQGDGAVVRLDPKSGEVSGRVKVREVLKYGDIDTGGGKVWLRTTEDQTFVVIDPKTMTVSTKVGKAEGSGALRYTKKGVWTSAHDVHTVTWWPEPKKIAKK